MAAIIRAWCRRGRDRGGRGPDGRPCARAGARRGDASVAQAVPRTGRARRLAKPSRSFRSGRILYYGSTDTAQAAGLVPQSGRAGVSRPPNSRWASSYDFGFGVERRTTPQALVWYRKRRPEHGQRGRTARRWAIPTQKGRAVPPMRAEAARWYRAGPMATTCARNTGSVSAYFDGTGDAARLRLRLRLVHARGRARRRSLDNRKQLIELRNIAAARMTPEQAAAAARCGSRRGSRQQTRSSAGSNQIGISSPREVREGFPGFPSCSSCASR